MTDPLIEKERQKYEKVCAEIPGYHCYSPADGHVQGAIDMLRDLGLSSVLDAGCGSARATLKFLEAGFDVEGVDHTMSGVDSGTLNMLNDRLKTDNLWGMRLGCKYDLVFCVDVMEHIPTERVYKTLSKLATHCKGYAYFSISLNPDSHGKKIGEVLHETVRPADWWLKNLRQHFLNTAILAQTPNVLTVICEATCKACSL